MSGIALSSNQAKKNILRTLLLEAQQAVKIVVESSLLTADDLGAGFNIPPDVLRKYPDGIPLDLNPVWEPDFDFHSDLDAFFVTLSFGGRVIRSRIPFQTILVIVIGTSGCSWNDERVDNLRNAIYGSDTELPRMRHGLHVIDGGRSNEPTDQAET